MESSPVAGLPKLVSLPLFRWFGSFCMLMKLSCELHRSELSRAASLLLSLCRSAYWIGSWNAFVFISLLESLRIDAYSHYLAYNKWHQTELERWLSDHDVPYPTPADRKELENLVKDNWDANVVTPYQSWDTKRLQAYLTGKGKEVKKGTEQNKDSLVSQVQQSWQETGDQATDGYNSVKDWIFDTYAFL